MKNLTSLCLMLAFVLGSILPSYAQSGKYLTGVVLDETGQPLPGAAVSVPGTTLGTSTDMDGLFNLNVPEGTTVLLVTFIGYEDAEVVVGDKTSFTVTMVSSSIGLEEVVAIGYGTQKKSVVTAAIASINSDELAVVTPTRIDNVLKGLTSGVTVTLSDGQPGSSSKVRVRGIGTINNSDPLYIVDGMPIDGGIDYLNPTDIKSIEVLKDAASAAVYGARGANGVILVTTKSGIVGKPVVTYNYSYSVQNPWKEMDVLNATEYAILMNEIYLSQGSPIVYNDPYSLGEGTDWQKELFNYNAPQQVHQLSISGANDQVNYFISAGYFSQDGIVGGDFGRSNYDRFSLRSNSTYTVINEVANRDFLNKALLGMNVGYTRITAFGVTTNSEFGGPLGSALGMSPTLSVYTDENDPAILAGEKVIRDDEGRPYMMVDGGIYNEMQNPLALLELPGTRGDSDKFVSSMWAEINLWKALKFKSNFGVDLSFWGSDGWTPVYYLNSKSRNDDSSVSSEMHRSFVWQVENTLSWEGDFDAHHVEAILGQSAKVSTGTKNLGGRNYYLVDEIPSKANLAFCTGTVDRQQVWGGRDSEHHLASYFARVSYNYAERYMLQATIRRDGSSNFGPNNHWGTFPSVSFGWNITNESFMEERPEWLTSAKLRASWGTNGNENIGSFGYVTTIAVGNNYPFGKPGSITVGAKPSSFTNTYLKWEESAQTDIGLDLSFFNNALTFNVDYYVKKTNGMLMSMPTPSYAGDSAPTGNVGDMKNSGVEFDLGYRHVDGDFQFHGSINASYTKNELVRLGNDTGWANYDSHKIGTLSRAQNGMPFLFFYGWKTDGIFQTDGEVAAYVNEAGEMLQPKAIAGDVRFKDLDNDGDIDDDDREYLGKGMPDWTFGLNIGFDWKGLDFSALIQGVAGCEVMNVSRRTDLYYINLPAYMLNRWTGPGTSNKYPRMTGSVDNNQNWRTSDLWVEDGAYCRLKDVQLGYTLPESLTDSIRVRLYVAGNNLITLTKYTGFDPEIASGGTALGIDRGVYPQSKVYTFGASVTF